MSDLVVLVIVGIPLLAVFVFSAVEVVRRPDLTVGRRILWLVGLVAVPVLGLGAYVITRPPRPLQISGAGSDVAAAEAIVILAERRQRGELTDDEYLVEVERVASFD